MIFDAGPWSILPGGRRLAAAPVVCATQVRAYLVCALWAVVGLLGPVPARADSSVIELRGIGVQIYVCEEKADSFSWRLKGPEATLLDATGSEVGRHFAGPSWQAKDGSIVVGEALVSSQAPTEGSIPWLVLRAKSHSGNGVFVSIEYIVRSHTEGGAAPGMGCDQAHVGTESRVGYSAAYELFSH
jgi:hypothetical protein